jgi:hypothetical protein
VALSPALATLPASMTLEAQSWECEVVAFDGELSSQPARSKPLVIGNSPPGPVTVAISPASPTTTRDLVCELTTTAVDEDFEALTYRYVWKVNGKPWGDAQQAAAWKQDGRAPQANRVPPVATKRGDAWECEVTASDGQSEGPAARATARIDNSPPIAPRVAVKPVRPVAGQDLVCELLQAAADADEDPLSYRYVWLRDGVDQAFAPTSVNVPGRLVKAKDIWKCSVTPSDGTLEGKAAISPDVVVADAPAAQSAAQESSTAKRRRRR